MKFISRFLLVAALLMVGCDVAKTSRDTVAASYGYIVTVRDQNEATCRANPQDLTCQNITRAIAAHTLAVQTLRTYCSGTPEPGQQPFVSGGPCAPDKSVEPRLKEVVRSLDRIVETIKTLLR